MFPEEHHVLCNMPHCPDDASARAILYRDLVGTAVGLFPCSLFRPPHRQVHILMRHVMLLGSQCMRLEVMPGEDGEWWVRDTQTDGIFQAHQAELRRVIGTLAGYPPMPEVEILFERAGVEFDYSLGKYWHSSLQLEIAAARIQELQGRARFVDLVRQHAALQEAERSLSYRLDQHAKRMGWKEETPAERRRREVDEAGMPEGPPRGASNIYRKSQHTRKGHSERSRKDE